MTLKSRLDKLTTKLKPDAVKVHYFGWADCTWSESEGLTRLEGESKDDFCNRVHNNLFTKKNYF